jgi:hypothetical protein
LNGDRNHNGNDNRKRCFKWNGHDNNGQRQFKKKGWQRIDGPVENPEGGQIVEPLGAKPDLQYDRPPAFR